MGVYVRNQYWQIDPAVSLGLRRAAAFDWGEAEPSPKLERFWLAAEKFDIKRQGFTIPCMALIVRPAFYRFLLSIRLIGIIGGGPCGRK